MARIRHGEVLSLEELDLARKDIEGINARVGSAVARASIAELTPFDYLFNKLQRDDCLLPAENPEETVRNLKSLAATMRDPDDGPALDSTIPAAYTYFGQFVDHDITLEAQSQHINLADPALKPLPLNEVRETIKNSRTPQLDLDCVYGPTSDGTPVPRVCAELLVSVVSKSGYRPPGKDEFNDLPRKKRDPGKPSVDREALIGDARNDENLIISQLHVAFLRAHRALVMRGLSYTQAKKTLVEHYQYLIIHDFLRRIANKNIVDDILKYGNRFFRPPACGLYIPLEFNVAAYRFGHSMVRNTYDYNINFRAGSAATLNQLFDATRFSGDFKEFDHIPEKWIIQWENFLDGGANLARRIDTRLAKELFQIPRIPGLPANRIDSLAARNLLRGYLLRMPIGQSVAEAAGVPGMSKKEIERAAANQQQVKVLTDSGFLTRTPLWFYILAEAVERNELGPVGSTIVAEVLIGLVRRTEGSILNQPEWKPSLGANPGRFTLRDLFSLAGVWK